MRGELRPPAGNTRSRPAPR